MKRLLILFLFISFVIVPFAFSQSDRAKTVDSDWHQAWADVVQSTVVGFETQTYDLMQLQDYQYNPLLRFTNHGDIVITTYNTTSDAPQIAIANTTTPGSSATLFGMKVDYTGVVMTNNPDLYGVYVALPANYGSGTEAAASFNGAGKTANLAGHWEAAYFGNGTYSTWILDGSSVGVNTNGDMKQRIKTDDVSNPPTDAELDAIFGTPAAVGSGFNSVIDDDGAGTNVWRVWSDGTNWWYEALTKAS